MDKHLNTKFQQINPQLQEKTNSFSRSFVINPADEETLVKKGVLYFVVNIDSEQNIDTNLIDKMLKDIVHDSYYQTEGSSPIQTIEKTIIEVRDNAQKTLITDTGRVTSINFNCAIAVQWGNTLYLVIYGDEHIFLMRDGQIKPINTASEGKFSVASGIIKDGDVIILGTNDFIKQYHPETLVNQAEIPIDQLTNTQAALMIRFNVVNSFTQEEVIDFGDREANSQPTEETKTNETQVAPQENIETKREKVVTNAQAGIGRTKPVKMSKPNTNKKTHTKFILFAIVLALFVISIVASIRFIYSNKELQEPSFVDETIKNDLDLTEDTPQEQPTEQDEVINQEEDELNKVQRIDEDSFFYDMLLANEQAQPSHLVAVGTKLYVYDTNTQQLYESELEVPKLTSTDIKTNKVTRLINEDGDLLVIGEDFYNLYDTTTNEVTSEFTGTFSDATTTYLGFVYTVNNNKIIKSVIEDDALTDSEWVTDNDLEGATSMGIDTDIYILGLNGEIQKYTQGERVEFELEELQTPLSGGGKLIYNTNTQNIYVSDPLNKRVVVFNINGELVAQYKAKDSLTFAEIKDISVNENETKLYILAGTSVYEINL